MGVEVAHGQYDVAVDQNYQKMSRTRSSSSSFMIPKWLRLKSSKAIDIVQEIKYTDNDEDDAVSSSSSSMVTSTSSSSSSSSSDKITTSNKNTVMKKGGVEPASPKIGCMGQIKQQQKQKQKKNEDDNRYSKIDEEGIFLTTNLHQHTSSRKSNNNSNYFKLKNILFTATGTGSRSSSFRLSTGTSAVVTTGRSNSSRAMIGCHRNSASRPPMSNEHHHKQQQRQIDILELDPPLPVVKKASQPPPPIHNSNTIAQGEEEIVIGDLWRRRFGGGCEGKASLKGLQLEKPKHKPPTFLVPLPLTL